MECFGCFVNGPVRWKRSDLKNFINGILFVFLLLCANVDTQTYNRHCSRLIEYTEDEKGIQNVPINCDEGKITWKGLQGAIRIIFQFHDVPSDFRAYFKASAIETEAEISLEMPEKLSHLTVLNGTAEPAVKEFTQDSTDKKIMLFIETLHSKAIGTVTLEYELERNTVESLHQQDVMEGCRPCSSLEILEKICSSDFVLKGSMDSITPRKDLKLTEVKLHIKKMHRQKRSTFEKLTNRYTGSVFMSPKCGVKYGDGDFLFVGKLRFDHPMIQCVPRWEEWLEIQREARQTGTEFCELD